MLAPNHIDGKQQVTRQDDVGVHVAHELVLCDSLGFGEDGADKRSPMLISLDVRHMLNRELLCGGGRARVVPEEHNLARWIQFLPATDRVPLDDREATGEAFGTREHCEHRAWPSRVPGLGGSTG